MDEKEIAKGEIWRFSLEHEEKEKLLTTEESGKVLLNLEEAVRRGYIPFMKEAYISAYFSWLIEGGFLEYRAPENEIQVRIADGTKGERLERAFELWKILDHFTHAYDSEIACVFAKSIGEQLTYQFLCVVADPQGVEIHKVGNKTIGIELRPEREGYHIIGRDLRSHMAVYSRQYWSYNGTEGWSKYYQRWGDWGYWQIYEGALLCVLKSGYAGINLDIRQGKIGLLMSGVHNWVMKDLGACCKLVESVIDPIIFGEKRPIFQEVEPNWENKEELAKSAVLQWCQKNYSFLFEH